MKWNKLIAMGSLMAMLLGSATNVHGADYCYDEGYSDGYSDTYVDTYGDSYYVDTGGCGYEDCRRAPCIGPAVALGTIAVVAVIAVLVQNNCHGSSGHSHSH